ncbi:MAG: hypothetical protein QOJ06_2039 [Pseudonocardiales bacterium]|jgi:hypothetical protein|nr:hypothetical protein [Pseudonocardiales bacterium]
MWQTVSPKAARTVDRLQVLFIGATLPDVGLS